MHFLLAFILVILFITRTVRSSDSDHTKDPLPEKEQKILQNIFNYSLLDCPFYYTNLKPPNAATLSKYIEDKNEIVYSPRLLQFVLLPMELGRINFYKLLDHENKKNKAEGEFKRDEYEITDEKYVDAVTKVSSMNAENKGLAENTWKLIMRKKTDKLSSPDAVIKKLDELAMKELINQELEFIKAEKMEIDEDLKTASQFQYFKLLKYGIFENTDQAKAKNLASYSFVFDLRKWLYDKRKSKVGDATKTKDLKLPDQKVYKDLLKDIKDTQSGKSILKQLGGIERVLEQVYKDSSMPLRKTIVDNNLEFLKALLSKYKLIDEITAKVIKFGMIKEHKDRQALLKRFEDEAKKMPDYIEDCLTEVKKIESEVNELSSGTDEKTVSKNLDSLIDLIKRELDGFSSKIGKNVELKSSFEARFQTLKNTFDDSTKDTKIEKKDLLKKLQSFKNNEVTNLGNEITTFLTPTGDLNARKNLALDKLKKLVDHVKTKGKQAEVKFEFDQAEQSIKKSTTAAAKNLPIFVGELESILNSLEIKCRKVDALTPLPGEAKAPPKKSPSPDEKKGPDTKSDEKKGPDSDKDKDDADKSASPSVIKAKNELQACFDLLNKSTKVFKEKTKSSSIMTKLQELQKEEKEILTKEPTPDAQLAKLQAHKAKVETELKQVKEQLEQELTGKIQAVEASNKAKPYVKSIQKIKTDLERAKKAPVVHQAINSLLKTDAEITTLQIGINKGKLPESIDKDKDQKTTPDEEKSTGVDQGAGDDSDSTPKPEGEEIIEETKEQAGGNRTQPSESNPVSEDKGKKTGMSTGTIMIIVIIVVIVIAGIVVTIYFFAFKKKTVENIVPKATGSKAA